MLETPGDSKPPLKQRAVYLPRSRQELICLASYSHIIAKLHLPFSPDPCYLRTIHTYKMIRKITLSLGRHVSSMACGATQVRRLLHGGYVRIHPSVQEALVEGRPVVALESTIITHGMAYPLNLSMAREVEEIVRINGAVPATVGILRGQIHVGLTDEELEFLASSKNAVKVSRRDFPFVLSQGLSGGTTVSGTMITAHKAGIPVFVTGGIGGVHRDGENTLDVSADLTELGRTPVAVVSAGAKSILDIGRTLEYLETQGVCVAAFGESREFPAFFSRQSGFQAPYHVRDEEEAAKLIDSALGLGLSSGVLIAVPCPQERAAKGQAIEKAIQQALSQARSKGITGKEVTPFLLQKLTELTDGKSLDSNLALIQNNARVGSCIAVALSKLQKARRKGSQPGRKDMTAPQPGGGQTNAGRVRRTFGGVGRNLADCLSRLGQAPLLLSAVGKDEHLESVLHYCHHMDMSGVLQLEGKSTATYCAVITSAGELSMGLGDMDIHHQITEQYVSQFKENLCQAPLVCIDGNLPLSTIQYVCQLAREHQLAVCYEPTDENKASKPFLSDSWKALTYISPNLQELRAINRTLGNPLPAELPSRLEEVVQAAVALACPLLAHLHCVVVTLGAHGVLLCGKSLGGSISLYPGAHKQAAAARLCAAHYPAIPISREEIVNVSGAGDSLMAGILAGVLAKHDTGTCVRMGLLAASLSLRSYEPISPEISTSSVNQEQVKSRSWPEAKIWKMD
ncbi:pseudouridine-metabolizing bifunctional protein C1861.05-like isoform X2 [Passer montanus]|uniref:pseudouridine-metabolizing bifunctional protein C1861.05-like isoform X2 n=1 Tax=Passer montanus TaxID=9160 RepID=UPI00195FF52A|nr:pseudouridine-metabolizing bifunctional protein C1861.05-like isoform X2 [Passer montanus]